MEKNWFLLITLENGTRAVHPSEKVTFCNTAKQGQRCLQFRAVKMSPLQVQSAFSREVSIFTAAQTVFLYSF